MNPHIEKITGPVRVPGREKAACSNKSFVSSLPPVYMISAVNATRVLIMR